jgi:UDP-2,3-diacylglucosamine pyrophosphatase LpxH
MPILVIQISDIHFGATKDTVAALAGKASKAIIAKTPRAEACFIAISGDVANSGDPTEYGAARRFLQEIKSELMNANVGPVNIVAVPGNHDLNLRLENDTRRFLLDSLDKYLATSVDFEGSTFDSIISVQNDFFQFESEISGLPALSNHEKLYYRRSFWTGERTIVFHCFNTAWLSRRHEQQAKLFLPPQIYDFRTPTNIDLSVAILHHPYNWLESSNQKLLKSFIESEADVALTGHEHDADMIRFQSIMGQNLDYLRAPAFSDPAAGRNGFQCLSVDFEKKSQEMTIFAWDGTRFIEEETQTWTLRRNTRRATDPLSPRPEFLFGLRDVGTGFRHPRCIEPQCSLSLRDLFVYPDLKHHQIDKILKGRKTDRPPIQGKAFAEFLSTHSKVVIFGADDCGKTSFAKILYEDLAAKGLLPLLLNGEQLRRATSESSFSVALARAITQQYATNSPAPYLQADRDKLVLLVDDFDKARLSKEGQRMLIDRVRDRFDRVVLIAPDFMEIQDMLGQAEADPFFGFERCGLKEFGQFHRQKLIENWLRIGRETFDEGSETIHKQVVRIDKTISTLLGKNVLPHRPVIILSLLQLLESSENASMANGAYGYLYEMLLKQALAKVNARNVDEKITYISGIGYAMFKKKEPRLTEEEMRIEHDAYCDKYDMVRDFSKMIDDLVKAEVLVDESGEFRFKYPYEFYYSTAKYFQDHAEALRGELFTISDHIYGERNANVLIFYVYLTKDDSLIRHIIDNARRIFSEHKECDMEGDVEFMNRLSSTTPPPLELEYGNADARRDELNKRRDEAQEENVALEIEDEEVTYDGNLQELTKILISIKTLQILGQILRNFTASLEGPLKLDITKECYSLGLRSISAILSYCRSDIPGLRQYIGTLIAERTGITDKKKLASRTEEVIVWMGTASTASMVKRVSYAAGHVDLTKTYRRVLEADSRLSVQIIDAAIRLDHFEHVPERELSGLAGKVRKNNFAFTVIRELIAEYLYFYEREFPAMQSLGAQWNIAVTAPKYLGGRGKK